MENIFEYYVLSNDPKILQSRIPHALTILNNGQFIRSLDPNQLDRIIISRISTLLASKDIQLKIFGCRLLKSALNQMKDPFSLSFGQWVDLLFDLLQRLSSAKGDRARFYEVFEMIDCILMFSCSRTDLCRDVVNDRIGSVMDFLVSSCCTTQGDDDEYLQFILSTGLKWITTVPNVSLIRPACERLDSIAKKIIMTCDKVNVFPLASTFIIQVSACLSKQGCSDKYYSNVKTVLATISVLFDQLFATIDENSFRAITNYPTFEISGSYVGDFIEFLPRLVADLIRMFDFLENCIRVSFPHLVVPLPLAEMMDVMKRGLSATVDCVAKEGADMQLHNLSLVFIPTVQLRMISVMTRVLGIVQTRIYRYKSSMDDLLMNLFRLYEKNPNVMKNLFVLCAQYAQIVNCGMSQHLLDPLATAACKSFVFSLKKEQQISDVEQQQQSTGKKIGKRKAKTCPVALSRAEESVQADIALSALRFLGAVMQHAWPNVSHRRRMYIDNCLVFNIVSDLAGNAIGCDEKSMKRIVEECKQTLAKSIKYSGHEQSTSIPVALNLAQMCSCDCLFEEVRNVVRPLPPAEKRVKRNAAVEESVGISSTNDDDEEAENNEGTNFKVEISKVDKCVSTAMPNLKTFGCQTVTVEEVVSAPIESVPIATIDSVMDINDKENVALAEAQDLMIKSANVSNEQMEKLTGEDETMEDDFSDLGSDAFSIVDAGPDE